MVEQANIVKHGKLVSYDEWSKYIGSLKNQVDKKITEEPVAIDEIKNKLVESVKNRIPKKKFGIFFSGGVDSTLIAFLCKKFTDNFICYTVGMENSKDILFSEKVAKELKLNYKKKIFSLEEMEDIFEETAEILGEDLNIVNLGVGAVELTAIKLAKQDKINIFFGGLGSEEIFAGYQRHENSKEVNKECWIGLNLTYKRDFIRDFKIANATNTIFLTPFLDKELIIKAMNIDASLKLKSNYKKYILRKVAQDLGLKKEFSFRPKKAAQYGSSFDKAIKKLAKSKGYKYKKAYLNFLSDNK